MTQQNFKTWFQQSAAMYNNNYRIIRMELSLTERNELMKKYNAESDSHLAKIMTLRGINPKSN